MSDPVVIAAAARTPWGAFQGALASVAAPRLGAIALGAAVSRARLRPEQVDEVILGCALSAGLGQAPARQAALAAGLPEAAGCTTVNKVCGSGMKAVMLAHDLLLAGSGEVLVAGGMESMSNAPYLLPKARAGYRLGHGQAVDHLFLDGLEDSYGGGNQGSLMGSFAEDCASHFGFTRAAQDDFARTSTTRAQQAMAGGAFTWEIVPVKVPGRSGEVRVEADEAPPKARLERISTLPPAFGPDGTVTAANASSIADGAAAVTLMRRSIAESLGLSPIARIVGHASHAQAPAWLTTAPAGAVEKLLVKVGWRVADVDLWEINEAFAVLTLAAMQALDLPLERVNIHGGACALGHPVGASGARILVTLLGALRKTGGRRGVASLCDGGGEATAIAVEMEGGVACGARR